VLFPDDKALRASRHYTQTPAYSIFPTIKTHRPAYLASLVGHEEKSKDQQNNDAGHSMNTLLLTLY